MRILLIEDDEKLCEVLKFQLQKEGFAVDLCHDGESGDTIAGAHAYDLILLDRMLPGMDGLTLLKRLRAKDIQTPVIMLTALGGLSDKVNGLNSGADDYIVKPFAFEELLARIRSVCRRPSKMEASDFCSYGDVSYDCTLRKLSGNGGTLSLSKREGTLLELFLRNPAQTLPRELILSRVWGPYAEIESGNLDNYIHFLRRRLKVLNSNLKISTVRGVGYRIEIYSFHAKSSQNK